MARPVRPIAAPGRRRAPPDRAGGVRCPARPALFPSLGARRAVTPAGPRGEQPAGLHPGRIDLGLGRAPGTDPATLRALRRHMAPEDRFPEDVVELLTYLGDMPEEAPVRAIPGAGTHVPVWILGSSLYGAQLAAYLGLPYAFASHFAPAMLEEALAIYRRDRRLSRPPGPGRIPRFLRLAQGRARVMPPG